MDLRLLGIFMTILLVSVTARQGEGGGCTVSVRDDFSGFYPLIFDNDGAFWPYKESDTEDDTWDLEPLNNGKEMVVSCAPNYLRNFRDKKTVKFTCQDKLVNEFGVEKKWKDVTCELRPVEEIETTVDQCETPSHTGIEFGYVNPVTKKTVILGSACYSPTKGHTEIVHMKLKPAKRSFEESSIAVQPENYFRGKKHPSGRYKIDLMKAWGDYAKNRPEEESIAIMPQRFALPQSVHLSTMKKLGWNYAFSQEDHNTWTHLQLQVLAMVEKKEVIVDYYAGSHGVLFDLNEERFSVPEYLWMFVRDGVQGIVFVVYNKVDMTQQEENKFHEVCSSKCDQVQWLSSDFKAGPDGKYVLCCDVNDARASIKELPLVTGITHTFLY